MLTTKFTPEIKHIVTLHVVTSAAIAILPVVGPTAAKFNTAVMLGRIAVASGMKLSKDRDWVVVKKVGLSMATSYVFSTAASALPGFGSIVSAAIEGGMTYAMAVFYVNMLKAFSTGDLENMTDEEFEKVVGDYADAHKGDIKAAFEEGKKFYKENKNSVSKDEIDNLKNSVMNEMEKEKHGDLYTEDMETPDSVMTVDDISNIETTNLICASCGAQVPHEAKFCLNCGNKIETKRYCIECGCELPLEARFCLECGKKI